ncbi:MAG: metallophosphoesterase [Simkania sp.]|nr:metallophosphoesterase [Simkania sp.]MCB1074898.1 metallophosphoesterase [Simkania sp.]MCB1083059.1 metallophosphoesterase [Simkania sp.]MCP5490558.1 metallophosphoesterase [Chlamydiales bacterium]MCP5491368.1 metallophosphoesterase [Chlamydiales bacterium]
MKTLIIADLHNKIDWVEKCIKAVKPDQTVFLGDYFDSFDETVECTKRTAYWLNQSLHEPKRVHLLGNHDMPYRFPMSSTLLCPGFTHEKSEIINEILDSGASWDMTKSFHWAQGYLMSHAGIHQNLLHPIKGFDLEDLSRLEEESFLKCYADMGTPLFGCGYSRGGNYPCGGITWQDFDMDFSPIEGVNQIVGHTPHTHVKVKLLLEDGEGIDEGVIECYWDKYLLDYEKVAKKSLNFALDTHRQHYVILEDGKVQVMKNIFAKMQDFSE